MRKYISLLLFLCSLNIFAVGLPPAPQPETLQAAIRAFIEARVDKNKMSTMRKGYWIGEYDKYSEVMNIPFCCDSKDSLITAIIDAFETDEKNCYQYVHEVPGSGMLYSVSLDSKSSRREITRKSKNQEFYMLCAKNDDNPRFRDMYTISYVKKKEGKRDMYEGSLYHIYSPRPDLKDDEEEEMPKMPKFILVGMLDKQLADSCRFVGLRSVDSRGGLEYGVRREKVVDGRFVFTKQLGRAADIQIAYAYKNGKKSEWQTIRATPGTTLYATFHKDNYDIDRQETDYTDDENSEDKRKMARTDEALKNYSVMLKSINEQIRELRSVPESAPDYADVKKRLSGLHKSAKDITNKMQDLVEKVAKELE
jgi:hypothetical protein